MAKPAHHHTSRPPPHPTTPSSLSSRRRRRPQCVTTPSAGVLIVLASLANADSAHAIPTEHDVPDFLCPVLIASRGSEDRGSEIGFAQDKPNSQPTSPSCSETTTSLSSAQATPLYSTSTPLPSAESWLPPQDYSLTENSISPRYRRLTQSRAKRANTKRRVLERDQRARRQNKRELADHYARNIPDRYELGEDGLWHKVEFYASCSRCQSDPHDVEDTATSDIGVDRDSSSGSTISASDGSTVSNTLPSLKYPDNWVRPSNESTLYRATIIVVMSFFIAAAVCCCIAVAVLWRRRRKRARQQARKRDLEKSKVVEESDGEYNEMDEGGSETGCFNRRAGETKEERRRRRKAELAAARTERGRDEVDDEEYREKKRWARASARWKAHVRWIRRRKTGNKRILDNMMHRDAASSCISFLPPNHVDGDEACRATTTRRRSLVSVDSAADRLASSSSPSGSSSARSRTTSSSSASAVSERAVSERSSTPTPLDAGNAHDAVNHASDDSFPPLGAEPSIRPLSLSTSDAAQANSEGFSRGSHADGSQYTPDEFATLPPPPANPRSSSRRAARASTSSTCTYDRPPPNSPPHDATNAVHALSTAGATITTDPYCLTGGALAPSGLDPAQDESRNLGPGNDALYQRPPAYRSRWREARSGHISEEGDEVYEYSDGEAESRRARRNEKSTTGSGYASDMHSGSTFGDDDAGLTALHVATDDKHVLARLTEAASAPPSTVPPSTFPSDPLAPRLSEVRHSQTHASAPDAPDWEDDATFFENLDSPGAGPSRPQSHQVLSSILPAPPKPVSSSLAFPPLSPPSPALSSFSTHDTFDSASSAGAAVISGKPRGVFGESNSAQPGPSSMSALASSSTSLKGMARFNRFTFAEEELLAGAEPEAGPSAPPFTDDDAGKDADFIGEASAPPLFEDDDEHFGVEGEEEVSQEHSMTTSPAGGGTLLADRSPGQANVEERPDLASAVR